MPPMLRRRRKTPKPEAHGPRPAGRSRRRARPEAPVPSELILPSHVEAQVTQPATRKPASESKPQGTPARHGANARPAVRPERPELGENLAEARGEVAPQALDKTAHREPHAAKAPKGPVGRPPARGEHGRGGRVVLVTGFEPFAGETSNPSWEICERLPRTIAGLRVEVQRVPCEFRRAIEVAAEAVERWHPDLVLALGQAGGRTHLSVERIAINVDDARIADNAGVQPVDEAIAANGPPAYFSTVPVKAMVAAMRAAGAPAEVSNSAGTYVCNHLMYGVLHYLAASGHPARAGFIHVPFAEEQVLAKRDQPSMALASMVKAVEAAIAAAVRHDHDLRIAEGTLA